MAVTPCGRLPRLAVTCRLCAISAEIHLLSSHGCHKRSLEGWCREDAGPKSCDLICCCASILVYELRDPPIGWASRAHVLIVTRQSANQNEGHIGHAGWFWISRI